jgi:hypothetical protein
MTDWYERTIKALELNGKGDRTQESYARAVRMLSEFCGKTPDLIRAINLTDSGNAHLPQNNHRSITPIVGGSLSLRAS